MKSTKLLKTPVSALLPSHIGVTPFSQGKPFRWKFSCVSCTWKWSTEPHSGRRISTFSFVMMRWCRKTTRQLQEWSFLN